MGSQDGRKCGYKPELPNSPTCLFIYLRETSLDLSDELFGMSSKARLSEYDICC